jgi:tetratricopeptide (TPR) repeat protein
MPKVLEYADRALELDPGRVEGHWLRSLALFFHYHRWEEAEAAARHALALDPTFPDALQQVAVTVAARGRTAEAVELIRQALIADPASCCTRTWPSA